MAVDYATLKKGGFMRQKQKNNFSLRLAVVGGNLTAKQLAKIAEVAEKYGDGHVHLTSRQGVEIPFIKLDQIDEVKAELEKTNNVEAAAYLGTVIAKKAIEKGITSVVFDRGGFIYHGKIKALADAAREAGLNF